MSGFDDPIEGDFEEEDLEDELDMFVEAQDTVWNDVLAELEVGKKTSHWMWFVFPQLAILGQSHMSQLYGLENVQEAEAYLRHPVLRARFITVCGLLLAHHGADAAAIFGDGDAAKLRSSMTLFAAAENAPQDCAQVLEKFFANQPCAQTQQAIG